MKTDPITHYDRKIKKLEVIYSRLKQMERSLSLLRVLLFFSIPVAPTSLFYSGFLEVSTGQAILWSIPSTFLFGVVFYLFQKRKKLRLRTEVLMEMARMGRSRIDGTWVDQEKPFDLPALPDPAHPFELDANLFGDYSLFRYLDRTVTRGGKLRLAELLRTFPGENPHRELQRRIAIQELAPARVIHSRLMGALDRSREIEQTRLEPSALTKAIEEIRSPGVFFPVSVILVPVSFFTMVFHNDPNVWPLFLILYPIQLLIFLFTEFQNQNALSVSSAYANLIQDLSKIMRSLRSVRFQSPRISQMSIFDRSAAKSAKRLATLLGVAQLRSNPFFHWIFGIVFLYTIPLSYFLHRWKKRYPSDLSEWSDDLSDLDAFVSLAIFAADHPGFAWPQSISEKESSHTILDAKNLGQVLIHRDVRVGNDVRIDHESRIWILTGSNMSGKSTLLRTVAQAWILASAGAPVPAERFFYRPIQLMSSIQISDDPSKSLSLFYAEVKRIRELIEAAKKTGRPPLFFLVDEMFRGTNNRERLIASRSVILELQKYGAAGIISTHDLELTEMCREKEGVVCKHFQESIKDQKMHFDYLLKEGPVSGTNALKILQQEGIPIETKNESYKN